MELSPPALPPRRSRLEDQDSFPSSESLEQTHPIDEEPYYDLVVSERFQFQGPPPKPAREREKEKPSPMSSIRKLFKSKTDYEDVSTQKSPEIRSSKRSSSISSFRRVNSDRFKHKISTLDSTVANGVDKTVLQRTPSVDKLDDRMDRSLRSSISSTGFDSSSDEEDEGVVVSPDHGQSCAVFVCLFVC